MVMTLPRVDVPVVDALPLLQVVLVAEPIVGVKVMA